MLTASQCEVVAAFLNGELLCLHCARNETSALTISKAEAGHSHGGGDLSLLIRYELDEYNGERAYEYVEYELGLTWEKDREAFDKAVEDYPDECCGSCGTAL